MRRLPSGRYQAHYRVDGVWFYAPDTFRTKREAQDFLAATRSDLARGAWINPNAGEVRLGDYARDWLAQRVLRPRTYELYHGLLRRHLLPELGDLRLNQLTPARVRKWHAGHVAAGSPGASTLSKSYRLLHAILRTAVEDGLVPKNPCLIRGAAVERPAERPVATLEQVFDLADAVDRPLRAMVLLATFAGLRLGELRALRRGRIDLLHRRVTVVEQLQQLADGTTIAGPPKSDAGRRSVAIPQAIVPDLETHLANFVGASPDALVFVGSRGQPIRLATFYTAWHRATREVGLTGFHFHDLRHTGNTVAAATGASTKELMSRMGHASPRAALIYQHATRDRDSQIAEALSTLIDRARSAALGP